MAFGLSKLKKLLTSETAREPSGGSILGIDIGASAIKFVQIHNLKNTPTLETYGELQLGPYEGIEIGRTTHLPTQKIMEALIDIIREASATGTQAVYSLSYGSSFMSTISVPTADQSKIEGLLPVEARKYIPISLSKVTLDWVPLGVDTENKVTNILLSAVYNEAQAQYEKIMHGCKLGVLTREIEIFSTIRSVVSPDDEVVAVLDLGASATRLYVVEKGVITKTHSVPLSGVELTRTLSEGIEIGFEQAEELKRDVGLLGAVEDPRVQTVLVKTVERGIRELHTVLRRHDESSDTKIQKLILSGGGGLMKGMQSYMTDAFSLPVELANPFSKVAYPAFLEDTLKDAGPSFAVAIGAALRGFQIIK